jgi:FixJ family two-component response regulator
MEVGMPNRPVISIVDDDLSAREGAVDLLNSMGFSAEGFGLADDFLKSDRLHTTACLIADVQMPGMTGLELYSRLLGSGTIIPTILITAYPDDADRVRAMQAGVICYLAKPYNDKELVMYIRLALESR